MSKTHVEKFEFEDGLTRLKTSIESLVRAEPALLDEYLTEGLQMGRYLVEHALSTQGLGMASLKDIASVEWAAEDLSTQADLIVRYQDATGVIRKAEYSAKSGESPPAAQSRGLGAYHLTIPQCRQFYRHGVQAWLDQNPILYPTRHQHGYEIVVDGHPLQGVMDLKNHHSSDEGVDLEHVPPEFYASYEEWNASGNLAMCDALLRQMSLSVDGMCIVPIVW